MSTPTEIRNGQRPQLVRYNGRWVSSQWYGRYVAKGAPPESSPSASLAGKGKPAGPKPKIKPFTEERRAKKMRRKEGRLRDRERKWLAHMSEWRLKNTREVRALLLEFNKDFRSQVRAIIKACRKKSIAEHNALRREFKKWTGAMLREKAKVVRAKSPEYVREAHARFYEKHREKIRAYYRAWYARNREVIQARRLIRDEKQG
jgi:hypothetical protein